MRVYVFITFLHGYTNNQASTQKGFDQIFIYKRPFKMYDRKLLEGLITEELTRSEVSSMIASKIDTKIGSSEFKRKVKELAAEVVSNLFKTLWQRDSIWKSGSLS